MARRDPLQEAKERYSDAKDACQEQYDRIREDFRFSNPSDPQQWDAGVVSARKGRPMHTLDRTNQFVQHVVNSHRQSETHTDIVPSDAKADPEVAKKIQGIFRHIEYTSRSDIAWDMASDHQARGGLGWVRILPKVVDHESQEQDIFVQMIHDPLSCMLDGDSIEPDGSDATDAFIESSLSTKAFRRRYPKAKAESFDTEGWFTEDSVRICEHLYVEEVKVNYIVVGTPGQTMTYTEDDYWALAKQIGYPPPVMQKPDGSPHTFIGRKRKVHWCILSGAEILDETEFPSQYIGLVPVQGHAIWIDNKRYLCGLVRRLMDGQKLHNFEMSALTESLMSQPKAPFLLAARAVDGLEDEWQKLNTGNPAYLTYNDLDDEGQPIAQPQRLSPPAFPAAYAQTADIAVREMESAVGMHPSLFGAQSNSISGRAKIADKQAGDTATFHFAKNRSISKQQCAKIILDMLPKVYSSKTIAKILHEDGAHGSVGIHTDMPMAARKEGGKIVQINPAYGRYEVRTKEGPNYINVQEEMGTKLQELGKGNPILAGALTPILMRISGMPEADKLERLAIATLPPELQQAYHAEDSQDMSPAAKAQIDQQGQQIQKMAAAMEQASQVIQDLQSQVEEKNQTVQLEAKSAMTEIKSAQKDLKHQADLLAAKERELQDSKRMVQLELELNTLKSTKAIEDAGIQAKADSEAEMESEKEDDAKENQAMSALAEAVKSNGDALAKALAQNTATLAQLQELTVDALEDLAEATGATRTITLQKDSTGKTTGATSVVVMPEPSEMQ